MPGLHGRRKNPLGSAPLIPCTFPGCTKRVQTRRGLTAHVTSVHLNPNSTTQPSTRIRSPSVSSTEYDDPMNPPDFSPPQSSTGGQSPAPPSTPPSGARKIFHPHLNGMLSVSTISHLNPEQRDLATRMENFSPRVPLQHPVPLPRIPIGHPTKIKSNSSLQTFYFAR